MSVKIASALVAVSLGLLGTAGCQWSEDRFLKREVAPEELAGSWVLRAESVRDLDSIGVELGKDRFSHWLELESDGGCELQTFLPADVELTGSPPAVTSSRCRWELRQGAARQQLWLELLDAPGKHVHYNFTETSGGELVIWQYIGDPDAWRYLEYSKEES
ncbi:MAG TPA: hypothetical protein VLF66_09365 [Thermoanaerobaculia bacterium]|nr:hypothetical protein [Thermoanaerobaculia bacterium]